MKRLASGWKKKREKYEKYQKYQKYWQNENKIRIQGGGKAKQGANNPSTGVTTKTKQKKKDEHDGAHTAI